MASTFDISSSATTVQHSDVTLKLPIEVVDECLEWAIASCRRNLADLLQIRYILCQVCSRWQTVVYCNPRNWDTLHLYRYLTPTFIAFWLGQSGNACIEVYIDLHARRQSTTGHGSRRALKCASVPEFKTAVLPMLAESFRRVRRLRIKCSDEKELIDIIRCLAPYDGMKLLQAEFCILGSVSPTPIDPSSSILSWRQVTRLGLDGVAPLFGGVGIYSHLTHLALCNMWDNSSIPWPTLRTGLEAATQLFSLDLHNIECSDITESPRLHLGRLLEFRLVYCADVERAVEVACLLEMPNVRTLRVEAYNETSLALLLERCGDLFRSSTHIALSISRDLLEELGLALPKLTAVTHLDLRRNERIPLLALFARHDIISHLSALRVLHLPFKPPLLEIEEFMTHFVWDGDCSLTLTVPHGLHPRLYREYHMRGSDVVSRIYSEELTEPQLNEPYLYT